MTHIMLYGPQGFGETTLARHLADMFGLALVHEGAMFKLPADEPALVVREATEADAYNLARAHGLRTVIHVEDARRLLEHAYGPPPLAGLEVVECNADLSPEEQRALDAAQANLRG